MFSPQAVEVALRGKRPPALDPLALDGIGVEIDRVDGIDGIRCHGSVEACSAPSRPISLGHGVGLGRQPRRIFMDWTEAARFSDFPRQRAAGLPLQNCPRLALPFGQAQGFAVIEVNDGRQPADVSTRGGHAA